MDSLSMAEYLNESMRASLNMTESWRESQSATDSMNDSPMEPLSESVSKLMHSERRDARDSVGVSAHPSDGVENPGRARVSRDGESVQEIPRGPVVVGIRGTRLEDDDRRRLLHPNTGGVILFTRNYEDRATLEKLVAEIKSLRNPPLAVMVDHEGGRVQRFKTGFARAPAMGFFEDRLTGRLVTSEHRATTGAGSDQRIFSLPETGKSLGRTGYAPRSRHGHGHGHGHAHGHGGHGHQHGRASPYWDKDRVLRAIRNTGFAIARELKETGIDLALAPVVDVNWGESKIIGNRSFSTDPHLVSEYALGFCQGLAMGGMRGCLKHFPGHGKVALDSHVGTPVDERTLMEIAESDMIPFAALAGRPEVGSMMSAHILYPRVDDRVASFSSKWLKDVLRRRLGFEGAVFSDDLGMGGAMVTEDPATRAELALKAGCDLLLVCNRFDDADRILEALPIPKGREAEILKERWRLALGEAPEGHKGDKKHRHGATPHPRTPEEICRIASTHELGLLSEAFYQGGGGTPKVGE